MGHCLSTILFFPSRKVHANLNISFSLKYPDNKPLDFLKNDQLRVGKMHNKDYKFLENNIFSLKLEPFENDPGQWDYTYKKIMINFVEYLNMWLLADKEKISLKGVETLEILKKTINDYKLSDSESSFMDDHEDPLGNAKRFFYLRKICFRGMLRRKYHQVVVACLI